MTIIHVCKNSLTIYDRFICLYFKNKCQISPPGQLSFSIAIFRFVIESSYQKHISHNALRRPRYATLILNIAMIMTWRHGNVWISVLPAISLVLRIAISRDRGISPCCLWNKRSRPVCSDSLHFLFILSCLNWILPNVLLLDLRRG